MNDPTPSAEFKGKVALVTDIASPLGVAIAEHLVKSGVIVHGVHPDHRRCTAQVRELAKAGAAFGHVVNLQDGLAAMQFAYQLNEEVPSLDFIVSNCRIASALPSSAAGEPSTWLSQIRGELAFVQELMDALRLGASQADPARVVLVGPFSASAADIKHKSLAAHTGDVAARLRGNGVALNVIQAATTDQGSDPTGTDGPDVVSTILSYFLADASQRYGELVHVAA